jgi:hypothetical protein
MFTIVVFAGHSNSDTLTEKGKRLTWGNPQCSRVLRVGYLLQLIAYNLNRKKNTFLPFLQPICWRNVFKINY